MLWKCFKADTWRSKLCTIYQLQILQVMQVQVVSLETFIAQIDISHGASTYYQIEVSFYAAIQRALLIKALTIIIDYWRIAARRLRVTYFFNKIPLVRVRVESSTSQEFVMFSRVSSGSVRLIMKYVINPLYVTLSFAHCQPESRRLDPKPKD